MPAQTYYAVFDGHNGEAAAVYASVHLLTNIVRDPAFKEDLVSAIKDAVRKTDANFCKKVWGDVAPFGGSGGQGMLFFICCRA